MANKVKIKTTNGKGWFSNCILVSDDNGKVIETYQNQGYGTSADFVKKYGNVEPLNIRVTPSVFKGLTR